MSNKLAPYKDPVIIGNLTDFFYNSKVRAVMRSTSVYSDDFAPMVYGQYIKWQAKQDPSVYMQTLNWPQFNKAFDIVVLTHNASVNDFDKG